MAGGSCRCSTSRGVPACTRRAPAVLLIAGILFVVAAGLTYWISAASLRPEPPGQDSVLGTMRLCTPYPDRMTCAADEMSATTITVVIVLGVLGVVTLALALRSWLLAQRS